ncbi:hypothetical protein WOLCODRAFT_161517 [Wolfiporia cocos MD-104 SS10]|uniref:Uncharacterized protein n=1 Tax=Wolfiporia cocos (strain MD-104) TaxID=742152 RepID=A0A2H3JQS9_WOLCO|nr:hypothetical protein WOLCODRAFT_161517 [Wolfiporia cocos MD-104 SS10]
MPPELSRDVSIAFAFAEKHAIVASIRSRTDFVFASATGTLPAFMHCWPSSATSAAAKSQSMPFRRMPLPSPDAASARTVHGDTASLRAGTIVIENSVRYPSPETGQGFELPKDPADSHFAVSSVVFIARTMPHLRANTTTYVAFRRGNPARGRITPYLIVWVGNFPSL